MLDSDNFVFYDNNFSVIWESFSFPTDIILGGQNLSLGSELVSSVSTSNHSTGRFVLSMQDDGNLAGNLPDGSDVHLGSFISSQAIIVGSFL